MIKIGILNLQGDVQEHIEATEKAVGKMDISAQIFKVETASDVSKCQGIIISGGESTVIGKLIKEEGIDQTIREHNIAVLGTCAGMIILGKKTDYQQPLMGLIDMQVKRNGFGRQKLSFEEEVEIFGEKFPGIFIRAPYASEVGNNTEILARIKDKIVAVREGKCIATAFHPELTEDTLIHEYFIKEVLNCVE
ncbi:MAG: pyridoxal 5'-phosphate synthase glutaminase subunit PdxT [Methanobacterium sp.]|nr:pyridoxal 5'-phosphate synthase glutaminase subunit PdxT [Methanobacterium sp.]